MYMYWCVCAGMCSLVFRYKEVLVHMMESVLRKIQWHYNIDDLREIDDDTVDDDVRTLYM